jgi:predicted PurR-regulated permease PerM
MMPTLTTRKIITGVLLVLLVLITFLLLNHFRLELILIFMGIVISISMDPVVGWLRSHKLPRSVSVILIYFSLGVVFFSVIFLFIPQTLQQVSLLVPRFENIYTDLHTALQNSSFPLVRQWSGNLPASFSSMVTTAPPLAGGDMVDSFNLTLTMVQSFLTGVFTLSVVLLIGFYWTMEGERMEYAFLLLFPVEKRESTRETIKDIETHVGGYVRGQGLLALAIGIMSLVAYFIIGLPSLLTLAFLAGIFELIPVVGPTLGAIPAVLVAFASSPSKIIWVLVATFLIQMLENHVLYPRIMQKTVGVNPMVTILAIIGFGSLFGFTGLLMAIPLAAIFQVILDRSLLRPADSKMKAPAGRDRLSKLNSEVQEYIQDIRKLVRRKEVAAAVQDGDEIEDSIEAIATDLEHLLAQTVQLEEPQ